MTRYCFVCGISRHASSREFREFRENTGNDVSAGYSIGGFNVRLCCEHRSLRKENIRNDNREVVETE